MPRSRLSSSVVCALALTLTATTVLANPVNVVEKRASPTWEDGYYNPTSNGGKWLTVSSLPSWDPLPGDRR